MPTAAAFRAFLNALNPAQREAVEQTEGPVMVLAGPGTGKTQMLAARVGKILLDTDTQPHSILCLTFTDAGVQAMRRRLLGLIGPEAYRVPVFTFHAFCNRIIQENADYFGRADLEPVSDLERIQLIRDIIRKLNPSHPLREGRKDLFLYESRLRDLFHTMKQEGWTSDFVGQRINDYLESLPGRPGFVYQRNNRFGKKGEPKTAKLEEEKDRMRRLRAATDLYPAYLSAMQQAGRYEYEDMLLWVLQAFEQHEALLRNYQERYLYVLVDEYQDTNGAQNRLLQLLLNYWESPNVFIVGDDDQSIYEFQGARLRNLLDFYNQYKTDLLTVILNQNYRSPQPLLDAARRLIEHNLLRVTNLLDPPVSKQLHATGDLLTSPEIYLYENRLHELSGTVYRIKQLLNQNIPAPEIAVLYARHKQSERLAALLDKEGIPYQTRKPDNLLDMPLIRQFRELLQYIQDEYTKPFSGESRLFRLLHAPFFNLKPLTLAQMAVDLLPNAEEKRLRWREALQYPPDGPDRAALLAVGHLLEEWIKLPDALSLPAFIERLYNQSGLLQYVLGLPDRLQYLEALNSFMAFVEAEAARNPRFSLGKLLDLLASMDDNRLRLEIQQHIRAGQGVQLLTAHSAKGLEFDYVFMLDCTEEAWEAPVRQNSRRFKLPDTLTRSGEEDALEARRRLFYVAVTRARKALTLSFASLSENGKPISQSRFVMETGLPVYPVQLPPELPAETLIRMLTEPLKPVITLPESSRIDEILERFTLGITALNRFLKCPLAFYYIDILGIPERASEAACYGQAMHTALQQFFIKLKTDSRADGLPAIFAKEMNRRRGYFSQQSFEQHLILGEEYLRRYQIEEIPKWRKKAIAERRIDRVEVDGIPVSGIVDRIEWTEDGRLRLVDFKTGIQDVKFTASPNEQQPSGGEYWRQLVFYKILIEQSRFFMEPVGSLAVSWLEPSPKGGFLTIEFRTEPEEQQLMRGLIQDVYQKIQNREFTEGCGKEDCPWCTMHNQGQFPAHWPNEEENLDDSIM